MSLQLRLRLLEEASRDPTIYELMILILSIIIVEAYFFSPGISFYLYFKGKLKSEYLPSFTIFFNLVNCILWVILGSTKKPKDIQMLVTNGVGFTVSLTWIVLYWVILSKNNLVGSLIHLFNVFNIIFQIFYFLMTIFPNSEKIAQGTPIAINVMMYVSTAQNMWQAIKLCQPNLLPIFGCICGLICSCGFVTYGAFTEDNPTMISNATSIAVLVPIIMVWAVLKYKNNNAYSDLNNKEKITFIDKLSL